MSNAIRFRRNGLTHKISPLVVKQRLLNPSKDINLKKADQLLEIDFDELLYDDLLDLARAATIDLLETDARYKKTNSATRQIVHLFVAFLERRYEEEWKKYNDSVPMDLEAAAKACAFKEARNTLPEITGSTFANVFANNNEVQP